MERLHYFSLRRLLSCMLMMVCMLSVKATEESASRPYSVKLSVSCENHSADLREPLTIFYKFSLTGQDEKLLKTVKVENLSFPELKNTGENKNWEVLRNNKVLAFAQSSIYSQNGKNSITSQYTFSVQLRPLNSGRLQYPECQVEIINETTGQTDILDFNPTETIAVGNVSSADNKPAQSKSKDEILAAFKKNVRIEAEIDKKEYVLGDTVTCRYRLVAPNSYNFTYLIVESTPNVLDAYSIVQKPDSTEWAIEQVNDDEIMVSTLYDIKIIPLRKGAFNIPSLITAIQWREYIDIAEDPWFSHLDVFDCKIESPELKFTVSK